MSKLKFCRICLDTDIRMHRISGSEVEDVYEKLTKPKIQDDGKYFACYICYRQLKNSQQLVIKSQKSEELLQQICVNTPELNLKAIPFLGRLLCGLQNSLIVSDIVSLQIPEYGRNIKTENQADSDTNETCNTSESDDDTRERRNFKRKRGGKKNTSRDATPVTAIDLESPSIQNQEAPREIDDNSDNFHEIPLVTIKSTPFANSLNLTNEANELPNENNYESSSESENDILMENECLDGSHEVSSSHCEDTNTTEKEKVSLREECLEEDSDEDDETNEENIEEENKVPEAKKLSKSNLKGKYIRERDFCYYCKSLVLNFSRHMTRHHVAEPEVQLALSHPKNSIKRKRIFNELRKKGNYVSNPQTAIKPMKKSRFSEKADYLPCSKCLGFYSRKRLWKHVKKCDNIISTNNAQVQAQNFLVRHIKVDNSLLKIVFPRMIPDKISLVAKKDKLICMFGAQYLRTHRKEHYANVVSRKMRELAKLLVEVRKLNADIDSFEQVLKPQYYDTLVHATKMVARFNEISRKFDAPTYAMNIAQSIKQCCNIALLQSYKMEATIQTSAVQADLKTLSKLIAENWKFDIYNKKCPSSFQEKNHKTSPKKKRTLVPWTTDQKKVVTKYFDEHIKNKKPPKRAECDQLKNKYSTLLQNKDWLKIKVYIQNAYSKQ